MLTWPCCKILVGWGVKLTAVFQPQVVLCVEVCFGYGAALSSTQPQRSVASMTDLAKVSGLSEDQANKLSMIGSAAASAALAKASEEDLAKVHNLAVMAASAAIEKHLDVDTEEGKEKAAVIAKAAAELAIKKGVSEEG